MPHKRTVGLSAGEAVLGLVIERPDTAAGLGQRLVERFRSARFTRSTAHNALSRLARQGLVRAVAQLPKDARGSEDAPGPGENPGEEPGGEGPQAPAGPAVERHYEATPLGVEHFRAWLHASRTAAPALREEWQAKIEFCGPEDVPLLIDALRAEERACAHMFAAIQGRLTEAELLAPEHPGTAQRWSELVHDAVLRDEAAMWGMRFKRLERLRARLEEMRDTAAAAASQ
jgi:DNA-binding PadR family transcriptional regulator